MKYLRNTGQRIGKTITYGIFALKLAWHAGPLLLCGLVILMLLQALLPSLELILTKLVIDRAFFDIAAVGSPGALALAFPLVFWIILAAAALVLGNFLQPFTSTLQSLAGDRTSGYTTEQIIKAVNRWHGLERFEDTEFLNDLHRARDRAARSGVSLLMYGGRTVLDVFTAIGLMLTLAALHPLVPVVLLLASLPHMALIWDYGDRTVSHLYIQTEDARSLEYYRDLLLTAEPAKDVRLYHLGGFFDHKYSAAFVRAFKSLEALRFRLTGKITLASLLASAAVGAAYLFVIWQILTGRLSLGDLALYGGGVLLLQDRFFSIGVSIGLLPLQLGFLPSLKRILNASPDLPLARHPRTPPTTPKEGIVFEHVAFTYPGSRQPVLRDVSFRLRPGEGLALVGLNGAGKTTIVKLLLRLYDPTAGRILLENVDLREYDLQQLRRCMSVIFQDFVHYELTAGENIAAGNIDALSDRQQILDAARQGGALELIEQLPEGLDTPLGRAFGGRELSGGEWQKLALARAFIRKPHILVLDEPTAALDVQTEYEVYQRFFDLTRGRMTLLISHRFSTVRMADRILYLEDGCIQEEGTHQELLQKQGKYARLFQMQSEQYLGQGKQE